MPRIQLPENIKKLAKEFAAQAEKGRNETNAANRKKTELRNSVASYWAENGLPVGSYIHAGGLEFRYEATESYSIDPSAVMELYENKEITRDQFIRMISVDMKEAGNVLGGDQVEDLKVKNVGSKVDIRMSTLSVEDAANEFIEVKERIKRKAKRSKYSADIANKKAAKEAGPRRRVKTRK